SMAMARRQRVLGRGALGRSGGALAECATEGRGRAGVGAIRPRTAGLSSLLGAGPETETGYGRGRDVREASRRGRQQEAACPAVSLSALFGTLPVTGPLASTPRERRSSR